MWKHKKFIRELVEFSELDWIRIKSKIKYKYIIKLYNNFLIFHLNISSHLVYTNTRKWGDKMIKSIKLRLIPTLEQEILMFKSVGVSR